MLPASPHSASLHMKNYLACNGSVIIVDYTRKSGDGGFADESGEEYEDVRENLRSVGFGKNPKGDRSFFIPAYLPSF